jgi:DNA-binding MarR family transcriptional regulator
MVTVTKNVAQRSPVVPRFDETIHAPLRLKICALLDRSSTVEFSVIRDILEVADSVTSKHLKALTEAGYVSLSKPTGMGGRVKTWASLTPSGRAAFKAHVAALQQIVAAQFTGIGPGDGT